MLLARLIMSLVRFDPFNNQSLIPSTYFNCEDDYHTGCQKISHCQQQQTVLLRTTFTWAIILNLLMKWLLGWFKPFTKNTKLPTLFPLCFSLKLSYWTTTVARYLTTKIKIILFIKTWQKLYNNLPQSPYLLYLLRLNHLWLLLSSQKV